ncbi:unnamed protein product [Microthlaspi erraticum]|uniref:Uncharacterized protein n=1 Tax=Microthlaspi erraticum TaxID=1685480 RepID=A0A6D2K8F1_9BRAS|nr:unnamed protein product [Microthlaspi erraticum]
MANLCRHFLNLYRRIPQRLCMGFRKVDSEDQLWEFEEEDFVRGQPESIGELYRRMEEMEKNSEEGKEMEKKIEERMRARRIAMKKTKESSDGTMKTVLMKKKIKRRVKDKKASKVVADQLQCLRV